MISKEDAILLDKILLSDTTSNGKVSLQGEVNKKLYTKLGNILKKDNFGRWLGGRNFQVFDVGLTFISNNSYSQRVEKGENIETDEISKIGIAKENTNENGGTVLPTSEGETHLTELSTEEVVVQQETIQPTEERNLEKEFKEALRESDFNKMKILKEEGYKPKAKFIDDLQNIPAKNKEVVKTIFGIIVDMNWISWLLIIASGVLLLFSFIAPAVFTQNHWKIDFTQDTGVIGDTIGGIMNPFISIVSVIAMFLAFYMQLQANKLQRKLSNEAIEDSNKQFRTQLKEQRAFNDMSILMEMLKGIESLVSEITFILIDTECDKKPFGLENIEKLNKNNNYKIHQDDFEILYDKIAIITRQCILFNVINYQAEIKENIKNVLKNTFSYTIDQYSKNASRFFELCKENNINIIANNKSLDPNNIIKQYEKQINGYIDSLRQSPNLNPNLA
ncbi:hypothetical protein FACS189440_08910 [Bacteroidia bacterium]|nr:hypothetical protein FACS189440_08910 [Bacteroidia bacterium]